MVVEEKILARIRSELEDTHEIVDTLLKERRFASERIDDLRMRLVQALEHLQASRAQCMILAQELDDIKRLGDKS